MSVLGVLGYVKKLINKQTVMFFLLLCVLNLSCGASEKKIDFMSDKNTNSPRVAPTKNDFSNALHVYLKEIENNNMLQKIKKNVDIQFLGTAANETPKLPYEQALLEGSQYFQDKKYDDAAKCFKKVLSYPSIPAVKSLEVKFMLMSCLRELGREPEYISQLNEYKQKYTEIMKSCEVEHQAGMANSALIQVIISKNDGNNGDNLERGKQKNNEDDEE